MYMNVQRTYAYMHATQIGKSRHTYAYPHVVWDLWDFHHFGGFYFRPAALSMRVIWLWPAIPMHPCVFGVCVPDGFSCIWCQKALDRYPSPMSAPTGQSDIAGSAENDYYNYHNYAGRLKTPGCAAAMHKPFRWPLRAYNFPASSCKSPSTGSFHGK